MSNFNSTPMMRALTAAIRANVPTLLWGDPGVGKTAKISTFAEKWGYHVECVVGGIREASDFMGLPLDVDGEVRYAPLAWARRLSDAPKGLLFLDELTTSAPTVQKAMLRIAQERFVGDHQLPETVSIVAAANPPGVAVDGWDLAAPVANRFMHLDWHFDIAEWLDGVTTDFLGQHVPSMDDLSITGTGTDKARTSSAITAFLRTRPDMIHKLPTDSALAGKGWASPRSWTNAMTVLAFVDPSDEDTMLLILKGCVGEGAATEYLAWLAAADLHDPIEVMDRPSMVEWKKERPDRLFALTTAVTAIAITEAIPDAWAKAIAVLTACAEGGRPDVATPGTRTLLNRIPKGAKVPAATRAAFTDLLGRTGRWATVTAA